MERSRYLIFLLAIITAIAVTIAVPEKSVAAGAFFPEAGKTPPKINRINAALALDGTILTMVLQPFYQGSRERFAWVVPVPSVPDSDSISTLSGDPFPALALDTDPVLGIIYFVEKPRLDYTGGCTGIEEKTYRDGGQKFTYPRNRVYLSSISPYEATILSNDNDSSLSLHLSTAGFDNSGANEIGTFYQAKNWHFVVIVVTPPADGFSDSDAMDPIVIESTSDELTLPLKAAAKSMTGETSITIYTYAEMRTSLLNYPTSKFVPPKTVQSSYEDYIVDQSRGRFIREFADYSPISDVFGSPLSSVITRDYMLSRFTGSFLPEGVYDDAMLKFHPTNEVVRPMSYVSAGEGAGSTTRPHRPGAWPLLPLALLLAVISFIRKILFRRTAGQLKLVPADI